MEFPHPKVKKIKAFSLVELLVSVSIIVIIATLSISAYPKFSAQMTATSESYRMLSFLREAQSYGVAGYTNPGEKQVYGVEISKGGNIKRVRIANPTSITNDYYVNNFVYESAATDVFNLKNIFEIKAICEDFDCDPDTSDITKALIFYKRSNPEGRLLTMIGSIINPSLTTNSHSRIIVFMQSKLQPEIKKKVIILFTGQIYVQDW